MKRITIIGSGAGGTLLAVNLLKQRPAEPVSITLIEKNSRFGKGVAFGTKHDFHLLNVPAAKMSAYPDEPDHFHNWLTANGNNYAATDFVPRKTFGKYLRRQLDEAIANAPENISLRLIDSEAVNIRENNGEAIVTLASGEEITSEKAVLAFGNFLPPPPNVRDLSFIRSARYIGNAWDDAAYENIENDDTVMIIGTGLSMADIALRFKHTGHNGKLTAISTRGLLPAVHELGFHYDSFADELAGKTRITDLFKTVRKHLIKTHSEGGNWRAVIDSLRPATQQMWLDLPLAEKRYFMQHLSRYWNVARHRMPPETAAALQEMQDNGKLEIVRGRLKDIITDADGKFTVNYLNNGERSTLTVDTIVNCIGPESNFVKIDSPLVKSLLETGIICADELKFGLNALPDGSLINKNGDTSETFFTLGTALKGILWESTAIPEIRVQAKTLAAKLLQ